MDSKFRCTSLIRDLRQSIHVWSKGIGGVEGGSQWTTQALDFEIQKANNYFIRADGDLIIALRSKYCLLKMPI